jgi:hypothetical protein
MSTIAAAGMFYMQNTTGTQATTGRELPNVTGEECSEMDPENINQESDEDNTSCSAR